MGEADLPVPVNDAVAALFAVHGTRVRRLVRRSVRAPDAVIEDACQLAWSRLLRRHDDIEEAAMIAWLVRTAVHEAYRATRRASREVSLDALLDGGGEARLGQAPGLDEILVVRERLAGLCPLPERQRRAVWLKGLGFSYAEIAQRTGMSERVVERQLLRARRALREMVEEEAAAA